VKVVYYEVRFYNGAERYAKLSCGCRVQVRHDESGDDVRCAKCEADAKPREGGE
jgi:hypothetical protein